MKLIVGDFFKTIPPGADAYIIKNVLLNWDDESVLTILKNCLQAMGENTRKYNKEKEKRDIIPKLLIIDMIISEEDDLSSIEKFVDIMMMVLTQNGRIRTEKEFSILLKWCGFDITNIIRSPPSPSSDNPLDLLSIIEAIPSSTHNLQPP